jgi:hypothetical protein
MHQKLFKAVKQNSLFPVGQEVYGIWTDSFKKGQAATFPCSKEFCENLGSL